MPDTITRPIGAAMTVSRPIHRNAAGSRDASWETTVVRIERGRGVKRRDAVREHQDQAHRQQRDRQVRHDDQQAAGNPLRADLLRPASGDAIEAGHLRTRWNIWNAVTSRTTTNSRRR